MRREALVAEKGEETVVSSQNVGDEVLLLGLVAPDRSAENDCRFALDW